MQTTLHRETFRLLLKFCFPLGWDHVMCEIAFGIPRRAIWFIDEFADGEIYDPVVSSDGAHVRGNDAHDGENGIRRGGT